MYKPRCVFVNLHPRLKQFKIVILGHMVDIPLIGDMGGDDLHPDAGFCRHQKGTGHFVVENQVGCHDVDVSAGVVEDVQIDRFRDALPTSLRRRGYFKKEVKYVHLW